jgi:hypothetical protein
VTEGCPDLGQDATPRKPTYLLHLDEHASIVRARSPLADAGIRISPPSDRYGA